MLILTSTSMVVVNDGRFKDWALFKAVLLPLAALADKAIGVPNVEP